MLGARMRYTPRLKKERMINMPNFIDLGIEQAGNIGVVSSLTIAERFEKEHDNLLRDIHRWIEFVAKVDQEYPINSLYISGVLFHPQDEQLAIYYFHYYITFKGFVLLAALCNEEKDLTLRRTYITEFARMERKR